jgi:hypothetical protein
LAMITVDGVKKIYKSQGNGQVEHRRNFQTSIFSSCW